jgi:nucleoside-diphosphate-sugar epimerase
MTRSVVLGGAGFLGSHLCDLLLEKGHEVVVVDDLTSGRLENLGSSIEESRIQFIRQSICQPLSINGNVDFVFNLASPASPPRYVEMQRHTLLTGSIGTKNGLDLATEKEARFIQASTSEIYGDPIEHPQKETYWGNVNPIGPRSCYDESKRFSEALCVAYANELKVDIGIARIFNSYGPRLNPIDGRVVSNMIRQALANDPITIYGDGSQTRSFCYVSDLVRGLTSLSNSSHLGPFNLGNPQEISINELSSRILQLTNSNSIVKYLDLPTDDPIRRCPDITLAQRNLGWSPEVGLEEGLVRVISDYG